MGSSKWQQNSRNVTLTHQETGTLLFPLVIKQFFSSGLIIWGEIVSEPLVVTIGRDLNDTRRICPEGLVIKDWDSQNVLCFLGLDRHHWRTCVL